MIEKGIEKGINDSKLIFPNWSEVNRFKEVDEKEVARLIQDMKIPANNRIILYSGNISAKQGLEVVIDAAKEMAKENVIFNCRSRWWQRRLRELLEHLIYQMLF